MKSLIIKYLFIILGTISIIIGFIGIFIPILPTTPLIMVGSFFLIKSSENLHNKLIQSKLYNKSLGKYKQNNGMRLKSKLFILIPVIILLTTIAIKTNNIFIKTTIIFLILTKLFVFIKIPTIKNNSGNLNDVKQKTS